MRKLNFRSFAYATLGSTLFLVGLIVVENPSVSFGKSLPDVLMFLGNEAENAADPVLDEETESYDLSLVGEETFSDESVFNEEINLEDQNLSSEIVDDSNEILFDDELCSSELPTGEIESSQTVVLSDDSEVELNIEAENGFESTNVAENVATTSEEEIDSLIEQVESVSSDLNQIMQEVAATDNSESYFPEIELNNSSDRDVQEFSDSALIDVDEVIQATNDSGLDSIVEETQESEDVPVIIAKQVDTVALPEEIERTLEETSDFNVDDMIAGSDVAVVSSETDVADEEAVATTGELPFKNAENFLSEDIVEESLNPNALEIEEINEEYGWKTVESDAGSKVANPVVGFDANVRLHKSEARRFNRPYNEQAIEAPSNEFWIVGDNGYDYYFWKYENNAWRNLSSDEFFSTDDPRRTTIIWAHGYQTDMSSATQSATFLNSLIEKGRRNTNQNKPYRLVVWKWNSERNMARIRVDAKNKTALARCSGVSLGKFIGRFNSSDDICLIGFSFGAQVVGAALQYLATHSNDYLQNCPNKERNTGVSTSGTSKSANVGKVSLTLISAACDLGAFNRGGEYASGATIPTKVLNVFNPYDFALRYYPFVSDVRSESFGVRAVSNGVFPNAEGRTSNFDVSGSVGREHSFTDEIGSIPCETLVDFFFND